MPMAHAPHAKVDIIARGIIHAKRAHRRHLVLTMDAMKLVIVISVARPNQFQAVPPRWSMPMNIILVRHIGRVHIM